MEFKETLKSIWNFLWNDNSLLSWIVSLALAFVIVKFVFFPLLSLIFASSMPLVVVESSSMHHPGTFIGNAIGLQDSFESWWSQAQSWYESRNINESQAESWPLRTGLEIGDIVLVSGHGDLEIGDIIVFNANQAHPIIHRIVNITEIQGVKYYSTKGDNNSGQLPAEMSIPESAVIGKALMKVPKLGWIKLVFVKTLGLG